MNKHKNSIIYHGRKKKKSFFEGWYFKQVDLSEKYSISLIPGVSITKAETHAFIQVIFLNDLNELSTFNVKYPISSFKTTNNPFSVSIGNNFFSKEKIIIDISKKDLSLKGEVRFLNLTPIKTSFCSPNIMGFFSYIPKMECNHGIVSMDHKLEGNLTINEKVLDFNKGKGYIEKDYGTSFPKEYIWIQSNHFSEDKASLFCSVAKIPFLGMSFRGFICNFVLGEKEFRFATYNGSRIKKYQIDGNKVFLVIKKGKYIISIRAEVSESRELFAPKDGLMDNVIKEGLSGTVNVLLIDKKGNVLFNSKGESSGIELVEKLKKINEK